MATYLNHGERYNSFILLPKVLDTFFRHSILFPDNICGKQPSLLEETPLSVKRVFVKQTVKYRNFTISDAAVEVFCQ